jgi:hypothetical protein
MNSLYIDYLGMDLYAQDMNNQESKQTQQGEVALLWLAVVFVLNAAVAVVTGWYF